MPRRRKSASRSLGSEFLALDKVGIRLANTVVFGRTNWTWRQGEQWAILGPDGSGKSVLINALLGRAALASGEIRGPHGPAGAPDLAPEEATVLVSPETQRQLAVTESSFYQSRWHSGLQEGQRTVSQFLLQESVEDHNPYEVNPCHGDRQLFQGRRRQYVRWLGIRTLLRRRLAHLSTGELRKTLLVRALLQAPRLLILEDPYAGLDAATHRRLDRVVERLMGMGWPVLLVTHRVEEIPGPTTHLLLLGQQKVLAQGPKDKMLRLWRTRFGPQPTASSPSAAPSSSRSPHQRLARSGQDEPLVELRGVTIKGDGRPILQHVTWTVRNGECWVVLGPNGAGKTTLLNLIQGDHPQAYSQNIRLFGRSTESTQTLWQARQHLGWMSSELHQHYPSHWPILDVVVSGFFNTIGLYQSCTRCQRALALQWLHDLGLGRQPRAALSDLPFGDQRLVLLARAVVKRPRLLILDEPCQGLDAVQRWKLLAAVDRVIAQANASLLFVTHHPNERPRCITHVLRLACGRVLRAGLLTTPARNRRRIRPHSRTADPRALACAWDLRC